MHQWWCSHIFNIGLVNYKQKREIKMTVGKRIGVLVATMIGAFLIVGCSGGGSSGSGSSGSGSSGSATNSNTDLYVGNLTTKRLDALSLHRCSDAGCGSFGSKGFGAIFGDQGPMQPQTFRTISTAFTGEYPPDNTSIYECYGHFSNVLDGTFAAYGYKTVSMGSNGGSNICYFRDENLTQTQK